MNFFPCFRRDSYWSWNNDSDLNKIINMSLNERKMEKNYFSTPPSLQPEKLLLGRTQPSLTCSLFTKKKLLVFSKKIKSKLRDFVPFSINPSPPTIKRDILIRDIFNFTPLPPHRNRDISEKKIFASTFLLEIF